LLQIRHLAPVDRILHLKQLIHFRRQSALISRLEALPIESEHMYRSVELPELRRDPFDQRCA